MAQLQINTTQNVNINFTAASVGERMLAYFIDLVIKLAYITIVYQLVFNLFGLQEAIRGMDMWSIIAVYTIFFCPAIFYSLIFEVALEGQTLGKRIMKIKVVKIDGYQASLADYVVRWFFRIVDINIMSGIVALISIVSSSKSQRLGDMTAGTSVISLKDTLTLRHTILEDIKEDYVPVYQSVIKLSDRDASIIKDTFTVAKNAKDHGTLVKLKTKIEEVIGTKSVHADTHTFIDTVLKDYNYFTGR